MDATNAFEDGSIKPDALSVLPGASAVPDAGEKSPIRELPRWHSSAAIYAFSASLAFVAVGLCLKGPLQGLGPVREVLPQGAMCSIIFVLWATVNLAPVSLHYRGNTTLVPLEEGPLLIGLAFLQPDLLVFSAATAALFVFAVVRRQPAMKVSFNVAATGLRVAVAAVVFRELLGTNSPVKSVVGWVAAVAAMVAFQIVSAVTMRVVTLLAGLAPQKRKRVIHLAFNALLIAASMCIALAFLDAAWFDGWATLPLLLVAGEQFRVLLHG